MGKELQFQSECCYVCGHQGYVGLLVGCAECTQQAIHKYCLGIVPGSDEDKVNTYWLCDYCSESMNSASNDQISDNTQIIVIEEQPEPLCTLFPEGHYKSTEEAEPTEIVNGVILIVSPSGETIIQDEIDTSILINMASTNEDTMSDKVCGRSLTAKPKTVNKRSERIRDELDNMFGWRRSPRFKRRKILQSSKRAAVC